MGQIPNGESFSADSSSNLLSSQLGRFKANMDSVLRDANTITIDLEPGRTDCPSVRCRYNPVYDRYQDITGGPCVTCKGAGFIIETRYTEYKCNRRWTNEPLDEAKNTGQDTIGGRIFGNFVRVKTVEASWEHIQSSIGATIDGVKVKLYREPRKTSWAGTNLYVISWWERMNKSNG